MNESQPITSISVTLEGTRGTISITRGGVAPVKKPLWDCHIANSLMAKNFGTPREALGSLVHCSIVPDRLYAGKHAYFSIGKVRPDFQISDGAVIKLFTPMQITTGRVIGIKEFTSAAYLAVEKVSD